MREEEKTGTIAVDLDGTILDFDWDSWAEKRMGYFGNPMCRGITLLVWSLFEYLQETIMLDSLFHRQWFLDLALF